MMFLHRRGAICGKRVACPRVLAELREWKEGNESQTAVDAEAACASPVNAALLQSFLARLGAITKHASEAWFVPSLPSVLHTLRLSLLRTRASMCG
jgi:hypothetical protein